MIFLRRGKSINARTQRNLKTINKLYIINNFNFFNTQNKVMMKRIYTEPIVLVEDVMVESGIAASVVLYGNPGEAGKEGSYDAYEDEL